MMHRFLSDPRHFQILTLSLLLLLQVFWSDFGPTLMIVSVTFIVALISQVFFTRWLNWRDIKVSFDGRSPLITALSLTILLKASVLWIYPLAACVAIASKFLIRVDNKHIFNPANIGIVAVLLMFSSQAWISPGQWGSAVWLCALLMCLALLVLFKIPRRDMPLLFLVNWGGMLLARALWLGDPLSIPIHQIQSGALLIFTFFMISDPKTIPDRFIGRFIFAFAVAACAFILTFEFRIREGLFYALAIVCVIRPAIDYFWQGQSFEWQTPKKEREKLS